MKIVVHFLNWDKNENGNLLAVLLKGYGEKPVMLDEKCYRTKEYCFDEEMALEDIYAYFNADDYFGTNIRPDCKEQRSMCVGDIIEFEEGDMWAIEEIGFTKIEKGA